MFNFRQLLMLFSLIILNHGQASASDIAKEKRWAEQISDSLLDGESISLKAGKQEFMAIFTESANTSNERAIILLHGLGVHPDWPAVIHPLRVGLPEHNWSTLSIQLPVLANGVDIHEYGPLFKQAAPRIQAATEYLQSQGSRSIVLVSHSLGAAMASWYIATQKNTQIKGLVTIGLSDLELPPDINILNSIEKIQLPLFDLYGSRDLDSVLHSAAARKKAAIKSANKDYQQKRITGADHFFNNYDDALVRTVYGWLKRYFKP